MSSRSTANELSSSEAVGTEAASVGLLAMRVASIVRRSSSDQQLDAADRRDLRAAREALLRSIGAARSVDSAHPRSLTRQLTSMGLIYAAAKTGRRRQDEKTLTGSLQLLVADLERLEHFKEPQDPKGLLSYYQRLSARARQQSSSAGERVIRVVG